MKSTKLFLDCEFDGFGGSLISIALVNNEGEKFYVVVKEKANTPWVQDNVIPILFDHPAISGLVENKFDMGVYYDGEGRISSREEAEKALEAFLYNWEDVTIIADWPEDFVHLFKLMLIGPGERIRLPKIKTELALNCSTRNSKIPHNALADAEALCEDYYTKRNPVIYES